MDTNHDEDRTVLLAMMLLDAPPARSAQLAPAGPTPYQSTMVRACRFELVPDLVDGCADLSSPHIGCELSNAIKWDTSGIFRYLLPSSISLRSPG